MANFKATEIHINGIEITDHVLNINVTAHEPVGNKGIMYAIKPVRIVIDLSKLYWNYSKPDDEESLD